MDLFIGLAALFSLFFFFLLFNFFYFNNFSIFYFNNFILFYFFLSFIFLPFLLSCMPDRVLVLQPGVRSEPLRWES